MNKPNGYEETRTESGFTPVEIGGHYAVIKRVEECTSAAGNHQLKVAIDFDKADKQAGYFTDLFRKDERDDKKWPANGIAYIKTEDENGNCSKKLKSFITSVERSNNDQVIWGEKFSAWFVGKKVGVVFGEQEEEYNGEIRDRRKIRWFCEFDKVAQQKTPQKLFLDSAPKPGPEALIGNADSSTDDVIPF